MKLKKYLMNFIIKLFAKDFLVFKAPSIIEEIYQSILGRSADLAGIAHYKKIIADSGSIKQVIEEIIDSEEYLRLINPTHKDIYLPHPLVFLHIQKTAGTSLQNMLRLAFGKRAFVEHADSLSERKSDELVRYSIFAGHFNYDSLKYIQDADPCIVTFVREPKERLCSLYYFLKAHNLMTYNSMKKANELDIHQFFNWCLLKKESGFWNHMVWVVMGSEKWEEWKVMLTQKQSKAKEAEVISELIRPAIRERLREFSFIGLQEDFTRSVTMMCKIFSWPEFSNIRADHQLAYLMKNNPDFKEINSREPITAELESLLDQFVKLDNIVYEEAKMIYADFFVKNS